MGLNIKNERVHDLARRAARVTGLSQTSVIEEALVDLLQKYDDDLFGRRSSSSAKLNVGDLFSDALTVTEGEPLLFKGNDFIHTDIEPALR